MQKLLKLPEIISKYLVAALLIVIPLYPKFPFLRIPGIYVSIRLEDFLLATLAVIIFIRYIPKIKELFKDSLVRSIFTLLLIGLVSLISGVFLTKTITLPIGLLHLFRRVEYFVPLFFVLSFTALGKKENIEFYIKTIVLTVFILFIYGFGQRYFNFPVIITQNAEYSKGLALTWAPGSHISSTFAGHYDMASFMVLILPILISLFYVFKDRASKIILAGASLSGFWLLVNSLSRVSLLSYIVAVTTALFLMKKYKAIIVVVLLSITLSAFSPNLFDRYKRIFDILYLKVVSKLEISAQEVTLPEKKAEVKTPMPIPVFEDRSSSIRFNVEWPRAIRAWTKNPLLGTGYSSISLATDNDYLRLLGEVGTLGFFAFLLILFNIAVLYLKALPLTSKFAGIELGFVAGVMGGVVGTLISALFIDVFEASKFAITLWLLIGLSVIVIRNRLNDQKI